MMGADLQKEWNNTGGSWGGRGCEECDHAEDDLMALTIQSSPS